MSSREIISTELAPQAIGPYSQAIKIGNTVYLSGQIPLDPQSMTLVPGGIEAQAKQVFENLNAVASAAGGCLDDAVKVNISLTDLNDFVVVNTIMSQYFSEPYPARACVQVAALPKQSAVEVEVILSLP
ncbi:MAG: reactive intermediate/imine deaminase [Paraglaciecola psychrophila]